MAGVERQTEDPRAGWTDLDWALFLLDWAEQSLVDEFRAKPNPQALGLLAKYRDRLDVLRHEYAEAGMSREEVFGSIPEGSNEHVGPG